MTHLILGCGYLGARVAGRWLAAGHRVTALTRSEQRAVELRQLGVEPLVGNVLDPDSLRTLPTATTVLYSVGLDRAAGSSMREVYVTGLANVLQALPCPGRFLYVSSTGVYGQCQGEEVEESAATEPLEESGRIVLEAERLLQSRLPGAILLRFAGMYGPGRLLRRQALEHGEALIGDPDQWLNLIHIEDGATAVVQAAERAQDGRLYNVCDDQPVRRHAFYTRLAELLHAPPPRFVAPTQGNPPHVRAQRRISNRRLRTELALELRYAGYQDGLPASVTSSPA